MPEFPPSEQLLPEGRKRWAIRAYIGLGEDGEVLEPMTQQEIADALGVSTEAVRNWIHDMPDCFSELSFTQRMTVYSIAVTGTKEELETYLWMIENTDADSLRFREIRRRVREGQLHDDGDEPLLIEEGIQ